MKKILSISLLVIMAFWASAQDVTNFDYTGSVQSFVVPATGNYQFEVWGAQGGSTPTNAGAQGGYATGVVNLTAGTTLYIYVGGQGAASTESGFITINGGYNGGGGIRRYSNIAASGGGATDISTVGGECSLDGFYRYARTPDSYNNRLVVAAGGGGAGQITTNPLGYGGGIVGLGQSGKSTGTTNIASYNVATGGYGTQTSGGNAELYNPQDWTVSANSAPGLFGLGGTYYSNHTSNTAAGGGGAGYYGGGVNCHGYGGGGSSYLGSLTDASTIAGNASMPNPAGGTMTGKSGNGYARITKLCDPITVDVSPATTVMLGTEVTITGTSANGGTITWDNGITNGVAFTANATTTYTATSTSTDDCPVSQTITVQKAVQVSTQAATDITTTATTANGTIVDTGDPTPTQHGFCWNTTGTPTTADSKSELGAIATNSTFTSNLTGLTIGETYFVRAYATNVTGTYYGDEITFTTLKLDQTISFDALSDKTYGDAGFDLTASASSTLPVTYASSDETVVTISGSTVTIVGAGSATLTASQAGNATYYAAADVEQTLTVDPKELTVADAVVTTKVYDGNSNAAITGATLTGVVGADDVTLTDADAGTFDNANVGTDKPVTTAITISGSGTSNYTLTQPVIAGDITAKELTVTDAIVTTKVYDGTTAAEITGATLTGVVGAEDVTLADATAGMFDDAKAGADKPVTHSMSITGAAIGNYSLTLPVFTGEITAKELTVTDAAVTTKVYDGNIDAEITGATLTGVVGADAVTLANAAAGQFNNANVGNTKPVSHNMSITGAAIGNYTFTPPVLTGNITAKELTVADAVVTTKVYDGNIDAEITGATLTGVVGADAVTLANAAAGQFNNANVGNTKPVSHNMSITGAAIGNYTFTPPVLTGNITAKELTVADAVVTTKVYDGNIDAEITGATLTGVVGADAVTLANAAAGQFNNTNVGNTKPVSHNMSITGAASGNYTLTPPVLTGNITAKELTVADAVVTTKVYDGTTIAEITGATLTGVVGAEDVTLANATAGMFDDANAGAVKPVTHSMSITGTAIGNYSLTLPVLTGEITAKELTVTDAAVSSKVYDGTATAEITGATLDGVLGTDDVTLGDANAGTFNDANVGTDKPVTTAMTISGAVTSNYTLTQPIIAGDITAKELTVTDAVITTKVYDGNTDAEITGATLAGVVGTDDVILADADAGTFNDANAGTDKPVTTAMSISGAVTGNYTLTQPVIAGDITAKELTVADAVVTTKVYDGTTIAEITGATLTGAVGAEDVTLANATAGMFDDANAGADKPVTHTMSITGAATDNYSLTLPVLTGEITAKELTVTDAAVSSKVYDGTTDAVISGAMLVGVIGIPVKDLSGDDVVLDDATTGIFADANVGNGIAVTTAMTISGVDAGNYSLTQPTLTGDITAKELTVTDAVITTKVYDGNTDAEITGATLAGVVGTDDVTLADADAGTFNDANVGTDKPVSTAMTISGAVTSNYTLTQPVIAGDITAKELTVADAVVTTKVYDGNTIAEITGATLTGVVGAEDVTLANATAGMFDDANAGADKPVTHTMSITGSATDNYSLTLPVLTGEITAKELTVTDAAVSSKVYDGTATAEITGATLDGILGTDDVTLGDANAGTFNDANVGTDKPVTTAMTISGDATDNYTLTQPVLTGEITAKELLITGTFEVEDKNHDGTTDATITVNNLVLNGLVTKDEVDLAPVAAFDSPDIGENIVVSLTDATAISGASAFNYLLSLTGAPTATANIIDPFINVDKLTGTAFTMYPNPVTNMLTVETGTSEILKIRLLSITGQEVFAGEIINKMQIDTSSLHPGIYFIAIIDGDQQSLHKLIKK